MTKKDILSNRIFIFLILLGYLEPAGISGMTAYIGGIWRYIHYLLLSLKGLSAAYVLMFYLFRKSKKDISKFVLLICIYSFYLVVTDILNINSGITSTILYSVSLLGIVVWIEIYAQKGYLYNFITVFSNILSVIVLLNFFSILLNPAGLYVNKNGWSTNWLMGYKNNFIYQYIPLLTMLSLRDIYENNHISLKRFIIMSAMLITTIMVNADTSTIIMLLFIIGIVFFMDMKIFSKIKMIWIYMGSMLLSALMIGFNFLNFFSAYISKFFSKDATASNRTYIWAVGLKNFLKNPILGYGNSSIINVSAVRFEMTHYHNKYLDLLCIGGVGIFVIWFLILYKSSKGMEPKGINYKVKNILLLSAVSYGILYLMEAARDDIYFFVILAMVYYCNALVGYSGCSRKRVRFKIY